MNVLDGSDQKVADMAMKTINDTVAEIPDQTTETIDDLFSPVANPEFVIKETNDNESLNESKS